jgi:ABC transport system ATP-binding/permease protein
VLDEPTNDLDVETLELLEDLLTDYSGTLLMVSHDRAFLDNVVTSVFAYEGRGEFVEYVGGYEDWLRQRPKNFSYADIIEKEKYAISESVNNVANNSVTVVEKTPKKRSYKEQRELETLPVQIEQLETEQQSLQTQLLDPAIYQKATELTEINTRLQAIEASLATLYERWNALEN